MKTLHLAILLSGSGSTAQAIIRACQSGSLRGITPVVVIGNNVQAGGLEKARLLGIKTRVVRDDLLETLQGCQVDLISQNGWLPLTPKNVVDRYKGRLINQHPGPLDPGRSDFGGIGMYGRRVTCARIAYALMTGGNNWTEATTHLVTEEFDKGMVIRAERLSFRILPDSNLIDATNNVTAKLLPLEHKNVIATLDSYVKFGNFPEVQRIVPLVPAKHENIVKKSKKIAIELFPHG